MAAEVGGLAIAAEVGADVISVVEQATGHYGPIELFCSNAGIGTAGGVEAPDADWRRAWDVNLMSHVWAARADLPGMLARGRGYFLITASAAGLLTQLGSAPYSVTEHAAVALAEWPVVTHGGAGAAARGLLLARRAEPRPYGTRSPDEGGPAGDGGQGC